ncbi:hypothetical protein GEOBRER4_n0530 [Citrifermentans bremense]|uniref:Uncharacterized protein n=1 Tax=Citrifermentans bremense TaxID=60035 RepID=A0A7R7FSZ9_9BACT|nr:hypothetical protein GEOBRER4_n0530 [Citrifermentans bremense]
MDGKGRFKGNIFSCKILGLRYKTSRKFGDLTMAGWGAGYSENLTSLMAPS